MPTYEYECSKCGHRFELFQQMSDEPRKRCPECRGKVERLISGGAGVIFKGSGFYETDYRSEGYKKAASAEKESSESAKKDKGSSDTKKETKSDTKKDKASSNNKT